jgi:hypothetical protein
MPTAKSPTGKKQGDRRDPFDRPVDPAYRGPRAYPRIGGYGGYGAENLARRLCRVCPADVHGHVEVFRLEEQVTVRVALVCGTTRVVWRYDTTCDPWEVTEAVQEAVLAIWQPARKEQG